MIARILTVAAAALTIITAQAALPPPSGLQAQLRLMSIERYTTASGQFIRFKYDVPNKSSFAAELFTKAPDLPPCGLNTQSSRTWVDFFDGGTDKRLYGFCALSSPSDLSNIWFALPEGVAPPAAVYIKLHDRRTNRIYYSRLEKTSLTPAPNASGW